MQQINLYQPILRKQKKVFSAKTLLQGNLLVLAGLLFLYGYSAVQTVRLETQLKDADAQRDQRRQYLSSLQHQYPQPVRDSSLAKQIEMQQQRLRARQALFDAVRDYDSAPQQAFSDYLLGLARQDLPSLWLRHIVIGTGQQLVLEGSALSAEDVPILLQRLGHEPAFKGAAFQRVVIEQNDTTRQIDFVLRSAREDVGGAQ